MQRTQRKNNSKCITLIALVITIVILILAEVSIAMLTGENGVLTKATEIKDQIKDQITGKITEPEGAESPEENSTENPEYWEKTTTGDSEWYSYADVSNGNTKVNANAPKLKGAMTPIK